VVRKEGRKEERKKERERNNTLDAEFLPEHSSCLLGGFVIQINQTRNIKVPFLSGYLTGSLLVSQGNYLCFNDSAGGKKNLYNVQVTLTTGIPERSEVVFRFLIDI